MAGIAISYRFFLVRMLELLFLPKLVHVAVSTEMLIPLARINQIETSLVLLLEDEVFREICLNQWWLESMVPLFLGHFPVFCFFFNNFGYCFEIFYLCYSRYGDALKFVLNVLVTIFSYESENVCFVMFTFTCFVDIKQYFIPSTFFLRKIQFTCWWPKS